MTATDGPALLRAIARFPGEDTPRYQYADLMEESGDPDRAEFIRVQMELSTIPGLPGMSVTALEHGSVEPQDPSDPKQVEAAEFCNSEMKRVLGLKKRESALLTAHGSEWRKGPVCGPCEKAGWIGTGKAHGKCTTCYGTGVAGGLMRENQPPGNPDIYWSASPTWLHKVDYRRGFPDRVYCKFGDAVERAQVIRRGGPLSANPVYEWFPTPWATSVVTHHPVTEFWVTDREPYQSQMAGAWLWFEGSPESYSVPRPVFDLLTGPPVPQSNPNRSHKVFPTPESARLDLAQMVAKFVRSHTEGE